MSANHHVTSKMVSVCILTYNHEKYIEEAIESVITQKVDFDYEIVITEDCSTDRTRQIVQEYQKKFPDLIRLQLSPQNVGSTRIVAHALEGGSGKYLALLEGDDYWSSPLKLQRQVDFLESNPGYSVCCHNVQLISDDGEDLGLFTPFEGDTLAIEDLLVQCEIHTCSVMYRAGAIGALPAIYGNLPFGDWPMYIYYASCGKVGFLKEVMGVYRKHENGMWNSFGRVKQLKGEIKILEHVNEYLGFRYDYLIRAQISRRRTLLAFTYDEMGESSNARKEVRKSVFGLPSLKEISRPQLSFFVRMHVPGLHRRFSNH